MKCAYFDSRSTTVSITDFPLMRGNPSTKSMVTSAHIAEGTSSGWSRAVSLSCSPLFQWQTSQARTKSRTKPCMLGIWKSARRRCKVFSVPSCLASWACARMDWSRGDVVMMKGRSHTVMMLSMMRHVSTMDQSARSSLFSTRKSSNSWNDSAETTITSLDASVLCCESASATGLVEPDQYSTVKSNPRSLLAQ
jgi:hypothetical protein